MKIVCKISFRDGRERFEQGEILANTPGQGCRAVTQDQYERFKGLRWALPPNQDDGELAPAQPPVNLDVQNVTTAQGVQHG